MSVLDHPIEFLPTSTSWIDGAGASVKRGGGKAGNGRGEATNEGTRVPTRRLKRLSLLNGRDGMGVLDSKRSDGIVGHARHHSRSESDEHTPTYSSTPAHAVIHRRRSDSTHSSTPRRYVNGSNSSSSSSTAAPAKSYRSSADGAKGVHRRRSRSRSSVSYSTRHSLDSCDGDGSAGGAGGAANAGNASTQHPLTPSKTPPMTLFDQHAPLLAQIAHKESLVNDLKNELDTHEKELRRLRLDWRKITSGHAAAKEKEKEKEKERERERRRRSSELVSPKMGHAAHATQTQDADVHVTHPTQHHRTPDRSASMRGRLISPVAGVKSVPSAVKTQAQPQSPTERTSHRANTSTDSANANAYLQQGVDMFVEGVGAFWDTLKSGPGGTPK